MLLEKARNLFDHPKKFIFFNVFDNKEYVQIDILEPKMVCAANVNYLSTARHHLLRLESVYTTGHVRADPHFDELGLRPRRYISCSNLIDLFPLSFKNCTEL